jgi:hypothetical protein
MHNGGIDMAEIDPRTVRLSELGRHLGDATRLIRSAMDSIEEEPELDFEAVRSSLRSALKLLGGGGASGASDGALYPRRRSGGAYVDLELCFPRRHPHRNS